MEFTANAFKVAADVVRGLYKVHEERALQKRTGPVEVSTPDILALHLKEVSGWCTHVQFYGMTSPADTASDTIALSFDAPRRFRSSSDPHESASEADLLRTYRHVLLLGDPGSGKTTTMKRVAQVLLTSDRKEGEAEFQYPVVVRLREMPSNSNLLEILADNVGVGRASVEALIEDLSEGPPRMIRTSITFDKRLYHFLNYTNAVVLLDGLDEVEAESQASCLEQIRKLSRNLTSSKIILTCRSGAQGAQLEGFQVMEICPLDPTQIRLVAEKWLSHRASAFLERLTDLPYHDVATRPLLIAQLLVLFKRYGTLPEQPAEVYRKVIRLMLEEWDSQRGIARRSKYARFGPERKAQFLSTLAYYLTVKAKSKRFTNAQLIDAYLHIYEGFGLPETEAEQVASELETHTGIIMSSGALHEFAHLSIQEFLCAEHLVKTPFPEFMPSYAAEYPAPLAVAVAISSDPTGWLAGLFLKKREHAFTHDSLTQFLSRLEIERPYFNRSPLFALSLMKAMHDYGNVSSVSASITRLLNLDCGVESACQVLEHYHAVEIQPDGSALKLRRQLSIRNEYGFISPQNVAVPIQVLEAVFARGCPLTCSSSRASSSVCSVSELQAFRW